MVTIVVADKTSTACLQNGTVYHSRFLPGKHTSVLSTLTAWKKPRVGNVLSTSKWMTSTLCSRLRLFWEPVESAKKHNYYSKTCMYNNTWMSQAIIQYMKRSSVYTNLGEHVNNCSSQYTKCTLYKCWAWTMHAQQAELHVHALQCLGD